MTPDELSDIERLIAQFQMPTPDASFDRDILMSIATVQAVRALDSARARRNAARKSLSILAMLMLIGCLSYSAGRMSSSPSTMVQERGTLTSVDKPLTVPLVDKALTRLVQDYRSRETVWGDVDKFDPGTWVEPIQNSKTN